MTNPVCTFSPAKCTCTTAHCPALQCTCFAAAHNPSAAQGYGGTELRNLRSTPQHLVLRDAPACSCQNSMSASSCSSTGTYPSHALAASRLLPASRTGSTTAHSARFSLHRPDTMGCHAADLPQMGVCA